MRLDMYTELWLMIAETIPGWFWRPMSKETCQGPSESKSIAMNSSARTRRLSIATSMRFDKLPFNWVNWWLQKRFQSPYVSKSHVTGNAKVGLTRDSLESCLMCAIGCELSRQNRTQLYTLVHLRLYSSEPSEAAKCIYGGLWRVSEIGVIHLNPHSCRQLQSRLPSIWLHGVIYFTDAAISSTSSYAMIQQWLLIWLPVSWSTDGPSSR